MTVPTDNELYVRGSATLLASWEEYARGSANAFRTRKPSQRRAPWWY
jgi:hypothetical protein